MDTLTRDTAKSYLWNQVAVTLDGVTLLAAGVLIGRILGAGALGFYGWVMSTLGIVAVAASLGFKEGVAVLAQRLLDDPEGLRGLFRRCLVLRASSALAAALVMAAALLLAGSKGPLVIAAICLYAAALLVSNLFSAFDVALFKTRSVAAGKMLSSAVTLAFIVVGALKGSLAFAFLGFALGAAAGGVVFFLPLGPAAYGPRRPYPVSSLLDLSLSLWLVGIFNYVIAVQGVPLTLRIARLSAADIGLFTGAIMIAVAANAAFMGGFANVTLAAFSLAGARGGRALADIHSLYVRVAAMFGVPILLFVVVFAPLLARIPVKGEAARIAPLVMILSASFLVSRLLGGGAHSTALYATGLHRAGLLIRAGFGGASFAVTLACALVFGIVGAAVAAGSAGVAVVAVEWAFLRSRNASLSMPWRPLVKLAAACGAIAASSAIVLSRGGVLAAAFAVAVFAVGSFCALAVARPLARGEASLIGATGLLAKVLVLFEARADGRVITTL